MILKTAPSKTLRGKIKVPGDKSISHRAAILAALAEGKTTIQGFLESEDCLNTLHCLSQLGVEINRLGAGNYEILGRGEDGLIEPAEVLDCGNSGTTMRLLTGVLASQPFFSILTGDASLCQRPMARVIQPLSAMGARIYGRANHTKAPLAVLGTDDLLGISYIMPTASAQVKSSILFAGLAANGDVVIREPAPSRNHTEVMLEQFGVNVDIKGLKISMPGGQKPKGTQVEVPGDISSAAFPMAAAAILPGSDIVIENVGINPTRRGVVQALLAMGADITVTPLNKTGEVRANIRVRGRKTKLRGIRLEGAIIPSLIDELPVIAAAAAFAEGTTVIKDAAELRVKECDRISAISSELGRLGVDITEQADGWIIKGSSGHDIQGGQVRGFGDHRIVMALAVLGLGAAESVQISDVQTIEISFPGFVDVFKQLGGCMDLKQKCSQ
ncbi:MAG: 3-phosphoshikimate 1-carboxyvinyltransferase [Firmicutes bacterium]|nr:3-phosphoshikimate 1-carboxyvinyltransferase [Bacillota bacterium]